MNTQTKFIIFIILVIVIVAVFGIYSGSKPGKLDSFAQSLKEKGVKFYGAFWCAHCQAQKDEFGNSKKYLPYIECSNPDQSQTQVCIDNKIESYPAWTFPNNVNIVSNGEPLVCDITNDKEPSICNRRSSQYFKTWIFPDQKFSIRSSNAPIKNGNSWSFEPGTQFGGEMPLPFLAEQIGFTLPQ
jgi:hypothetical protein